ncbi:MAG: T9SS type A sorting domain-containing protein [Calditrichaeota bacterium]|nr:T9SS type A sorting domain-containing protein [Calditrichota bacterium]
MLRFVLTIVLVTVFSAISHAQPPVAWMHTFDAGRHERFNDIYAIPDDGYIMCGHSYEGEARNYASYDSWVVRIDENGNQNWSGTYGVGDAEDRAWSIIETDSTDFIFVGESNGQAAATLIDMDGNQIWANTYAEGWFHAVIELKSGEFVMVGREAEGRQGYIICTDYEGNSIWEESYGEGRLNYFMAMRETQGGIIAAGWANFNNRFPINQVWAIKINIEGELIWSRYFAPYENQQCQSMVSMPEGGFALGCYLWGDERYPGDPAIIFINDNGDLQDVHEYNMENGFGAHLGNIARLDRGELVLAGYKAAEGAFPPQDPQVIRVAPNGQERWRRSYNFREEEGFRPYYNSFGGVTRGNDNSIVVAGTVNQQNEEGRYNQNGIILKVEPDVLEPVFLHYEPEDTLLDVLLGDTIVFLVSAFDQQGDEVSCLWIMGEDTLSTDSTTTVIFSESGDFDVQCQISDGEFTPAITWHISVSDFVIRSHLPEELELSVRRGSEFEFSLSAEALAEPEITYEWLLFDRNNQRQELGNDQTITAQFNLTGNQRLEGWALHGEDAKSVIWTINAHSVVWWWWPHENELSAIRDTTFVFEVFPFNEESDSLEYLWLLGDDALESDTSFAEIQFPDVGDFEITAYVQEGIEADTIHWIVDVIERSFTADKGDEADLPTSPVLYPPSPNPFNSSIRLSIYVPLKDQITLSIFDIQGRKVTDILDNKTLKGRNSLVWQANEFPAGVYFVEMESSSVRSVQKILLVR